MSATRCGDILPPELGFLPVFVTNLPPLAGVLWLGWNPETLVETFELPVESTDLPPLDRRLATAAVASVALTVAVTVVFAATPLGPSASWLYALFLLPFLTLIPKGL